MENSAAREPRYVDRYLKPKKRPRRLRRKRLSWDYKLPVKIGFFHLFWIFIIMSVLGLFVETLVSFPIDGIWKDRAGLIWGPFSPIYGIGAVCMTAVLFPIRDKSPWLILGVASVTGGVVEGLIGWFWKAQFGIIAWSYIDQPLNIGGYTCAGIALCWGIIGYLWIRHLLPPVIRLTERIPVSARRSVTAVMLAFIIIDIVMTFGAFACWFNRQAGQPVVSDIAKWFEFNCGDSFMEERFQTMSMYTDLARR